jgi:hypothetical protein
LEAGEGKWVGEGYGDRWNTGKKKRRKVDKTGDGNNGDYGNNGNGGNNNVEGNENGSGTNGAPLNGFGDADADQIWNDDVSLNVQLSSDLLREFTYVEVQPDIGLNQKGGGLTAKGYAQAQTGAGHSAGSMNSMNSYSSMNDKKAGKKSKKGKGAGGRTASPGKKASEELDRLVHRHNLWCMGDVAFPANDEIFGEDLYHNMNKNMDKNMNNLNASDSTKSAEKLKEEIDAVDENLPTASQKAFSNSNLGHLLHRIGVQNLIVIICLDAAQPWRLAHDVKRYTHAIGEIGNAVLKKLPTADQKRLRVEMRTPGAMKNCGIPMITVAFPTVEVERGDEGGENADGEREGENDDGGKNKNENKSSGAANADGPASYSAGAAYSKQLVRHGGGGVAWEDFGRDAKSDGKSNKRNGGNSSVQSSPSPKNRGSASSMDIDYDAELNSLDFEPPKVLPYSGTPHDRQTVNQIMEADSNFQDAFLFASSGNELLKEERRLQLSRTAIAYLRDIGLPYQAGLLFYGGEHNPVDQVAGGVQSSVGNNSPPRAGSGSPFSRLRAKSRSNSPSQGKRVSILGAITSRKKKEASTKRGRETKANEAEYFLKKVYLYVFEYLTLDRRNSKYMKNLLRIGEYARPETGAAGSSSPAKRVSLGGGSVGGLGGSGLLQRKNSKSSNKGNNDLKPSADAPLDLIQELTALGLYEDLLFSTDNIRVNVPFPMRQQMKRIKEGTTNQSLSQSAQQKHQHIAQVLALQDNRQLQELLIKRLTIRDLLIHARLDQLEGKGTLGMVGNPQKKKGNLGRMLSGGTGNSGRKGSSEVGGLLVKKGGSGNSLDSLQGGGNADSRGNSPPTSSQKVGRKDSGNSGTKTDAPAGGNGADKSSNGGNKNGSEKKSDGTTSEKLNKNAPDAIHGRDTGSESGDSDHKEKQAAAHHKTKLGLLHGLSRTKSKLGENDMDHVETIEKCDADCWLPIG